MKKNFERKPKKENLGIEENARMSEWWMEILLENEISHLNNTLAIGEQIKINVFSMLK